MALEKNHYLCQLWGVMDTIRVQHEDVWREILLLCNPYRGDLSTMQHTEGQKRNLGLYDTTGMQSLNALVNFIKGKMFPSQVEWMRLAPHPVFANNVELRQILDLETERVLQEFKNSNFYVQMTQALRDLLCIGNCVVLMGETNLAIREDDVALGQFYFESIHMGRVGFLTGREGDVQYFGCVHFLRAVDAETFFGKGNAGDRCERLLEQGKLTEEVKYLQMMFPNEEKVTGAHSYDAAGKPWVSVWIAMDDGDKPIVKESGFNYLPYTAARWQSVDDEELGRGLGHIARPDMKGVNAAKRQILRAMGRDLNPKLMVPQDMQHLQTKDGELMVLQNWAQLPTFLTSGTNYAVANETLQEDRMNIRRIYLNDLIAEPETEPRSAEESIARQLRALEGTATLADVALTQLLNPLVIQVINRMRDAGALPGLDEVERATGEPVLVKYISPFFTAQKQSVAREHRAYVVRRMEQAQAVGDPALLDDVDLDEWNRLDAEFGDIKQRIFRTPEEVAARRQARAQQEATQLALEQQQMAAQAAAGQGQAG